MKKFFIFTLLIFTSCSNIQLVQQRQTNVNTALPITSETSDAKDNSKGVSLIEISSETSNNSDGSDSIEEDIVENDNITDEINEIYDGQFRVIETWPLDQARDITLDKPIEVFFNKDVNEDTITADNIFLSIVDPLRYYEGDPFKFILLNYDPEKRLLIINSGAYDLYGEKIKVTLTDNIQTTLTEPLSPYTFSFTVKPPDELPPFNVVSTDPENNATFVQYRPDPGIRISYSNEVDQTTINNNTVKITLPFSYNYSSTEPINFNVRIDYAKQSSFLTLDPEKKYNGETILIELTDGIKDIFNQSLTPSTLEFTIMQ